MFDIDDYCFIFMAGSLPRIYRALTDEPNAYDENNVVGSGLLEQIKSLS